MRYFLDTEFYEDGATVDLISIGVVAEDGRELYAVSQDAQLHRVSPWVREHVLTRLPPYGDLAWMPRNKIAEEVRLFTGETIELWVDKHQHRRVPGVPLDKHPEFWGYYADYDWVVFCQLFGTMVGLPKHFPKFCRDLKQLSVDLGNPMHPPKAANEHDALADARWNRDLYAFLVEHRDACDPNQVGNR